MRESQATITLRVVWIPIDYNLTDLFTETKKTVNMINRMLQSIFYHKVAVIWDKDKK